MRKQFKYVVVVAFLAISFSSLAQQDPQFTHYMYNTIAVNPGYTGSRGHLSVLGLHRSQWVGLEGAPSTQSFSIHSPFGENVGLGLSVVNDELGPSSEFFVDGNFSYTLRFNKNRRLSFGIKGGVRNLNVDFSKGITETPGDVLFENNIDNRLLPTVGAGVYYHTDKWYLGLSVPNFITSEQYQEVSQAVAIERINYFLIAGYVFDINDNLKFKPSGFVKAVSGAPIIFDVSANFLILNKFTAGVAYRWDDSVSGLVGFQLSDQLNIGYSYDYTTTDLNRFNDGTHEIFLRWDFISQEKKLKSPRFF